MNFEKLKDIIINNNSFVITSHVNPDPDAIGSELALYYFLKKLDKKIHVINHSPLPYNLAFLDEENIIEKFDPAKHADVMENSDVLIALDLNHPARVVSMKESFEKSKAFKVCMDHHTDPDDFVDLALIDASYSSTGEIIYDLMTDTKLAELDYRIALPIYAAIMTDTGAFKYNRTTPKVHRIVAHLLELGVRSEYVFDQIYDQSRLSRVMLLGESISSMKLDESGQIAYQVITQELLNKTQALESEVDGFVNYCLMIEGVKIGLLFFELKDGIKISFRSKGKIPVNKLAAEFGGGGHANASGTRLFGGKLEDYVNDVVNAAKKYLDMEEDK